MTHISKNFNEIMSDGVDMVALAASYDELGKAYEAVKKERDQYALLIFQPTGASHHDANKCPYCKENLNGKS